MRIRSIRPEFWTSEDIARLDWHSRLVFIGLWNYVDDNGVGRDVLPLITASLFSLDMDAHGGLSEPSLRTQAALDALHRGGQITRYTVDGRRYLHITAWETHQRVNRPSAPRYPLPTCGNAVPHEPLSEPSVSPHAKSPLGEGEKGRRGEGEKENLSRKRETDDAPPPDIDDVVTAEVVDEGPDELADAWATFWAAYPVKKSKRAAENAFRRACKRAGGPAPILEGMSRLAPEWVAKVERGERQYIAHPSTWLNRDGWEDEPTPPPSNSSGPFSRPLTSGASGGPDLTARWREIAAQCDAAEAAR